METSPSSQILVLIPMLVGAALFQEGGSERASRSFPI